MDDELLRRLVSDWLPYQRWFGADPDDLQSVHILARVPLGDGVEWLAVGAQLLSGEAQAYQVPVAVRPVAGAAPIGRVPGGWLVDAVFDEAGVRHLLGPGHDGAPSVGSGPKARPEGAAALPAGPVRGLGAEQSNTSVVVAETVLVKVFRRLQPGINPDVEVPAALAALADPVVVPVLGAAGGRWPDPADGSERSGDLAVVQPLLAGSVDGLTAATRELRQGRAFAAADALGHVTARLHGQLAEVFGVRMLTGADRTELVDRLGQRLRQALDEVPQLGVFADQAWAVLRRLARDDRPIAAQRVHGDLHLGQVLGWDGKWWVIDFEGEPGTPTAQRRMPDSPLRDVAGMLRSFSYVPGADVQGPGADSQGPGADSQGPGADSQGLGAEQRLQQWRTAAERAFLGGYARAGGGDPLASALLLRAYLIDKAVYEARYEAKHRPELVSVPLAALSRLAGRGT